MARKEAAMRDSQNVTIVLLLAVAAVLAALVVATHAPDPALADTSISKGNYIIVAGEWSQTLDLVYVVNIATRRMNVYFHNEDMGNVELIDSVDLERTFGRQAE
jgi:hypothetical protein